MMQDHLHRGVTLNKSVLICVLDKRLYFWPSELWMERPTWLLVTDIIYCHVSTWRRMLKNNGSLSGNEKMQVNETIHSLPGQWLLGFKEKQCFLYFQEVFPNTWRIEEEQTETSCCNSPKYLTDCTRCDTNLAYTLILVFVFRFSWCTSPERCCLKIKRGLFPCSL